MRAARVSPPVCRTHVRERLDPSNGLMSVTGWGSSCLADSLLSRCLVQGVVKKKKKKKEKKKKKGGGGGGEVLGANQPLAYSGPERKRKQKKPGLYQEHATWADTNMN